MDPPPLMTRAWAVSLAGCLVSLLPCLAVAVVTWRSVEIRTLPARLPLHSIFVNLAWCLLHIISIGISVNSTELPCDVIGPIEHLFTVSCMIWYLIPFIALLRSIRNKHHRVHAVDEALYAGAVALVSVGVAAVPLGVNLAMQSMGEREDVYVSMANGICYIAPAYHILRFVTVTMLASIVFILLCSFYTAISCYLTTSDRPEGNKTIIRYQCLRYMIGFFLVWALWVAQDIALLANPHAYASEPWALDAIRSFLFYGQSALPSVIFLFNKWPVIRPFVPRWLVGLLSKLAWLGDLLISLMCFVPCRTGDSSDKAVTYPNDSRLVDGYGDAWDLATEAADAIEQSLPRRNVAKDFAPTARKSLTERFLQDEHPPAITRAPSQPINIPPASPQTRGEHIPTSNGSNKSLSQRRSPAVRSYKLGTSETSTGSGSNQMMRGKDGKVAYRNSPFAQSGAEGGVAASYGSQSSLSGAEESDFDAGVFASKPKEPKSRPTTAEDMTPTRGRPVHVYHIGSYGANSDKPKSVGEISGRHHHQQQPAPALASSMLSTDERQFHIGYEEDLPAPSLRQPQWMPSGGGGASTSFGGPSSFRSDVSNIMYEFSTSMDIPQQPGNAITRAQHTPDLAGSLNSVVLRIHPDDAR